MPDALTPVVALANESIQLPFNRFNPLRLLAHFRFYQKCALLGGHPLSPLPLHQFSHANNPFLKRREIACFDGQRLMPCLCPLPASLLFIRLAARRSRRGESLEDRKIGIRFLFLLFLF
ncbi:MAG: hypothetical protein ACLQKY_00030 [Terracidiphilus sp.]